MLEFFENLKYKILENKWLALGIAIALIALIVLVALFGATEVEQPTPSDPNASKYEIKPLGRPQSLSVKGGILTYDAVENAISYRIVLTGPDGQTEHTTSETFYDIHSDVDNMTKYLRIEVIAIGDGVVYSDSYATKYLIYNPGLYNESDGSMLTWDELLSREYLKISDGVIIKADASLMQGDLLIPEGVVGIAASSFSGCINLTEIIIPGTVRAIGEKAFFGCVNLAHLDICDGVEIIASLAFANCSQLEDIYLPESVSALGQYAFEGCNSIRTAILPTLLARIEDGVFSGCSALEHISIPQNLTYIGADAFARCEALKSLVLPKTLTEIGQHALLKCSALSEVIFSGMISQWRNIDKGAEWDSEAERYILYCTERPPYSEGLLYTLNEEEQVYTVDGIGECIDKDIVIPAEHEGLPVTAIGERAFYGESMLSITIEEGIKEIAPFAFAFCGDLEYIDLGVNLSTIEEEAFAGTAISAANIPNSVSYIGLGAFANNESLKYIRLGEGISAIPDECFYGCTNLRSVELLGKVTQLGESAFERCSSLITFTVPIDVQVIPEKAFYGCTDLASVNLGENIKEIDMWVFEGCDNLKTVNYQGSSAQWILISVNEYSGMAYTEEGVAINCLRDATPSEGLQYEYDSTNKGYVVTGIGSCTDSHIVIPTTYNNLPVTKIGEKAFYYEKALKTVTLSKNMRVVGERAFEGCTALMGVYLSDTIAELGKYAFASSGLEQIRLSQGISIISEGAFSSTMITSIDLHEGITRIEGKAFYDTRIVRITLPATLRYIGNNALSRCGSLATIEYAGSGNAWNSVTKAEKWASGALVTSVRCNDAIVSIDKLNTQTNKSSGQHS